MDSDTKQALTEWVNSFPLSEEATAIEHLSGGEIIWEILRDIDSSWFAGELPEASDNSGKKWLTRWENLKYIYQSLTTYLAQVDKDIPKGLSLLDLKMIAMESNAAESLKLMKLVLLAAISSPRAMEFISKMPQLSLATQNILKEWIVEIGESPQDEPNGLDEHSNGVSTRPMVDQELLFEERFSRLMAENDKLKKEKEDLRDVVEDLEDRLERSQENGTVLEHRLSKADERIRANQSAQEALGSNKFLESRVQHQEEVIARLEDDLSEARSTKESMRTNIDKLRASASKAQELQDSLDVMKLERDEFARKANTAEKYKQKLQAGNDLQKDNIDLREQLEEVRQENEAAKKAQQQVASFQLAVEEYKRVLPKIEQERHELQMMKKQLEFDNATLTQRCDKASEQYKQDQATIAALNERLRLYDTNTAPSTQSAREMEDLDSELSEGANSQEQLRSRVTELRDVNHKLKTKSANLEAEKSMLQHMLDDVREHSEEREKKHLKNYQEKLVLQSSLDALQKGKSIQDTEIFQETKNRLEDEQKAKAALEAQLKAVREDLQKSQNELSLIDTDKFETARKVKEQQSAELTKIQKENEVLKRRTVDLETDRVGLETLLKDNLSAKRTDNDTVTNKSLQEFLDKVTAQKPKSQDKKELEKSIEKMADEIREGNAKIAKQEEQLQKQSAELQKMQRSPASHPQQDKPTPAKTLDTSRNEELKSQAEYIANLERETRLMASAYHTLAGRLQMSNVSLQRRVENPSTWLNKQRRLVDQQAAVPGL